MKLLLTHKESGSVVSLQDAVTKALGDSGAGWRETVLEAITNLMWAHSDLTRIREIVWESEFPHADPEYKFWMRITSTNLENRYTL